MLCSWLSQLACSMTAGYSTQAYLWMGIYDSQHEKQVKLEKELVRTQERLKLKEKEYSDFMWTLHELSNGAGHAVVSLYRAGQLQERIPSSYASRVSRDPTQQRIWRAEAAMNSDFSREMYRL
jgi:hypothetical protein